MLSNIEEKKQKMLELDTYIATLKDLKVAKWDKKLWVALVDKMIVGKYKVEILFKDGARL